MPPTRLPSLLEANIDFVTERLAVGGDLDPSDAKARRQIVDIVESGITHVLDVRLEWTDQPLWDAMPAIDYRWDGIDDAGQRVPPEWFDRVATWALRALAQPDTKLLTHCHMGVNRGPSAGFAVLLALGVDPITALTQIRAARPIAHVAYAEDALAWHHLCIGASAEQRRDDLRRVATWRRDNALDVASVIRRIRRR